MGCCATTPEKGLEIDYKKTEEKHDVEYENASDPAGEKLVNGLAEFLKNKSEMHTSVSHDICKGFFNHFGNGEEASAQMIWGDDYAAENEEDFKDWYADSFKNVGE